MLGTAITAKVAKVAKSLLIYLIKGIYRSLTV